MSNKDVVSTETGQSDMTALGAVASAPGAGATLRGFSPQSFERPKVTFETLRVCLVEPSSCLCGASSENKGSRKVFLPNKLLESLPRLSRLPNECLRWNTNEVSGGALPVAWVRWP